MGPVWQDDLPNWGIVPQVFETTKFSATVRFEGLPAPLEHSETAGSAPEGDKRSPQLRLDQEDEQYRKDMPEPDFKRPVHKGDIFVSTGFTVYDNGEEPD